MSKVLMEARGVDSLGARMIGGYGPPNMGAGIETGPSARAALAPNH